MGSLVHTSHRDEVLEKLNAGLAMGGKVVLGGAAMTDDHPDGAFMQPTVVTGVTEDNLLFTEELFGPVLAVTTFSEESKPSTGQRHGIPPQRRWTQHLGRAHRLARDLQCGMVSINEYPITFPQTAFTGWKMSASVWSRALTPSASTRASRTST